MTNFTLMGRRWERRPASGEQESAGSCTAKRRERRILQPASSGDEAAPLRLRNRP
jgi:hypothetical protein